MWRFLLPSLALAAAAGPAHGAGGDRELLRFDLDGSPSWKVQRPDGKPAHRGLTFVYPNNDEPRPAKVVLSGPRPEPGDPLDPDKEVRTWDHPVGPCVASTVSVRHRDRWRTVDFQLWAYDKRRHRYFLWPLRDGVRKYRFDLWCYSVGPGAPVSVTVRAEPARRLSAFTHESKARMVRSGGEAKRTDAPRAARRRLPLRSTGKALRRIEWSALEKELGGGRFAEPVRTRLKPVARAAAVVKIRAELRGRDTPPSAAAGRWAAYSRKLVSRGGRRKRRAATFEELRARQRRLSETIQRMAK